MYPYNAWTCKLVSDLRSACNTKGMAQFGITNFSLKPLQADLSQPAD